MSNAREMIGRYIERMERLVGEIDDLKNDLKEIEKEATGHGLDVKALRKVIAIRAKDRADTERVYLFNLIEYASVAGLDLDSHERAAPTPQERRPAADAGEQRAGA